MIKIVSNYQPEAAAAFWQAESGEACKLPAFDMVLRKLVQRIQRQVKVRIAASAVWKYKKEYICKQKAGITIIRPVCHERADTENDIGVFPELINFCFLYGNV